MNDFTKSFQETIKRFDDLPDGKKADYERSKAAEQEENRIRNLFLPRRLRKRLDQEPKT